jgi:hypothetical protein
MEVKVEIGTLKTLKKPKGRYSEADAWVDLMVMQKEGTEASQNAIARRWGWNYQTVRRFIETRSEHAKDTQQNGANTGENEVATRSEHANSENRKESTPYNPLKENNPSPTTAGGRARDEGIFTAELLRQEHWLGWAMERLNMTGYKFQRAVREYTADCNARGKISKDVEDAKAHFINWVEKKKQYEQNDGHEKRAGAASDRTQEQLQWARDFAQYNALKYGTDACGGDSETTL